MPLPDGDKAVTGPCVPAPRGSWLGGVDGDPSEADIGRAWPMWATWTGADGLCYARRTEGAALTTRPSEDWQGVASQVRSAEAMLEASRPAGWREIGRASCRERV